MVENWAFGAGLSRRSPSEVRQDACFKGPQDKR